MGFGDRLNIAMLAASQESQRFLRRLRRGWPSRLLHGRRAPERLVLAPQDLWTTDSLSAEEIYAGRYFLAGRLVDCGSRDPFREFEAPTEWQRELHGFHWLRHLEAARTALTSNNAQALISDWLATHARPRRSVAWEEDVAARRLISWICHSVPVIETATPAFYRDWMRSIGTHIRYLKHVARDTPEGMPRLTVRIALAYAALSVSGQQNSLRRAAEMLDSELERQILEDGGHISRNPSLLCEILALLLPLRQSYSRLGQSPSQSLVSAIDRMMAALKFFRLGDGNLARFNGTAAGQPELLTTILFYDDTLGMAPENASASGYQRLGLGETVLIADTGKPPPPAVSQKAHAGTLSFEFSCDSQRIVINCGAPPRASQRLATLARSTAAHSTAVINDTSSSRFYTDGVFSELLENRVIAGPSLVPCSRENSAEFKRFSASHDGYWRLFGVSHHREITLRGGGAVIEGIDHFSGDRSGRDVTTSVGGRQPLELAIRFHLHPSVSAGKADNGNSIMLMCRGGIVWKFTCVDIRPEIEESLLIASASGPKRSSQIVLSGDARKNGEVRWLFERQMRP